MIGKRPGIAGGVAAAILAIGVPAPSVGAVIYDWRGACQAGCMGEATASLVLADSYAPGSLLSVANFVRLDYQSSGGTVAISVGGFLGFDQAGTIRNGPLPAGSATAVDLFLDFVGPPGTFFGTVPGLWVLQYAPLGLDERGSDYHWSLRPAAVPAPAPLGLLAAAGIAAAGIAAARDRRQRAV